MENSRSVRSQELRARGFGHLHQPQPNRFRGTRGFGRDPSRTCIENRGYPSLTWWKGVSIKVVGFEMAEVWYSPPLVFRSRSSNFFVLSTSSFTAMRLSYIRFIISWTTRDFRVPGHRSPSQLAARGSRLVRLRRVKSRWKNPTVLFVAHKVSTRTASSSPGLTPHAPSLGS